MVNIGIIMGSTRPGRHGDVVAKSAYDIASQRTDANFELIDLVDHPLPHLDEPMPASEGQYVKGHLSLFTDFENFSDFKPAELQVTFLHTMFDQLVAWSNALATLRRA